ncbi:MAG: DUF262 domain-containing protein [Thiolinea sp.]
MQTINFDIAQLLRKVKLGNFLIPQFQRDFVWKANQTRLLIDSISRSYPIGSLLILGKHESVNLKSRKLDAAYPPKDELLLIDQDSDAYNQDSYYILDGQQRLTSIARVFLDAHPNRNYFFDLKLMHEIFSQEDFSWIVSRTRSNKNLERKENNRLLRSDIALDQEKCDIYISEYIEDSGEFGTDRGELRKVAARLKGIFETIRKFSVPFVVLDSDAGLESVCRVFETINSTGTRLTTFDLAVAKYFPNPDLKEYFDDSLRSYPILKDYQIEGESFLQVLSLYFLRTMGKFPEATRSTALNLHPEFINANWTKTSESLAIAFKWISELGVSPRNQPNHGLLVSIAATLMCYPDSLNNSTFTVVLKKWYFCTILTIEPYPANNYKVGADFRRFCDFLDNGEQLQYPRVYFSVDSLIKVRQPLDNKYKAIQALMNSDITHDLVTGNVLKSEFEDHHFYPYSLVKSGLNKNDLNSIANRILVSKATNRSISNDNPEKYLMALVGRYKKEGTLPELVKIFNSCYIPYSPSDPMLSDKISIAKFDQFLKDRARAIIARIKGVVGSAWADNMEVFLDEDLDTQN